MKLPTLPILPDNLSGLSGYLRDFSNAVSKSMDTKIDPNKGVSNILLVSPSKKIYSITVSDAGTLSATLVQE